MTDILSLWRSPLDSVALSDAVALADRQPRCSIGYGEDFSAMTIYNYGYYVDHTLGNLTDALNTMFDTMSAANPIGGRAFIPQQSFEVSAPPGTIVPDQCDMDGSGGGGILGSTSGSDFFHFVITPEGPGASIFFNCKDPSGGGHTSGGIYFRSLAFQWGASSEAADTCIHADVWNVRAINCTFTDCPRAFGAQGLSSTLEQCTINYTVSATQGPNNTKAVILGAPQCAVVGPGQFAQTSRASGGATGCTCISIENAEHPIVSDMQILEWTTGIDFAQKQNTRFAHITNCEIECWQTALNIQLPASDSGTTAGIKVTSCTLAKVSDSTDVNPIVTIDAQLGTGNSNDQLNDVTLLDCTVYNMALSPDLSAQHGLAIVSGSGIKIIGGTYSNNGTHGGAGIAITGACGDIGIIGANLQPSYPGAPNINNQKYALLVSGSPTGTVLVSGCDMTGYSSGAPVEVSGAPTKLLISDCPGYNDQNTPLNGGMAPTSSITAAGCSTPYFGPSVIIYSNSSAVVLHVFGQAITSSFGIVFLPHPYNDFHFSTAPATFSWIGK